MTEKKKHGGPRTPGPGKALGKPRTTPDGLARYTIRLRPEQIEWLRGQENASALVRGLIDNHFKNQNPEL